MLYRHDSGAREIIQAFITVGMLAWPCGLGVVWFATASLSPVIVLLSWVLLISGTLLLASYIQIARQSAPLHHILRDQHLWSMTRAYNTIVGLVILGALWQYPTFIGLWWCLLWPVIAVGLAHRMISKHRSDDQSSRQSEERCARTIARRPHLTRR